MYMKLELFDRTCSEIIFFIRIIGLEVTCGYSPSADTPLAYIYTCYLLSRVINP
jgi:hypothetical protein